MDKYNWDLSRIYKSQEAFVTDIALVREKISKLNSLKDDFRGNFGDIVRVLVEIQELSNRITTFAHMKRDEDSRVRLSQENAILADTLMNEVASAESFFNPNLLELEREELDLLVKENKLDNFYKFLNEIFRYKDHTLTNDQEFIMGALAGSKEAPQNTFYMLTNADMKFPEIESASNKQLTNANFVTFLRDSSSQIRKEAFEKYYGTIRGLSNSIATMQAYNVKNLVTEAKIRKYDSARQMELFKDNVDVKVYDMLLDTVRDYLPSMHKYYACKKKVLGLDEQHMYDVYLSASKNTSKEIPFDQAKEMVLEALKPLGEEYIEVLKQGFDNNWIDVYPKEGKRSGAYSWGEYKSDPYVLMNYNNDLDSVFTLAHELGHSMHSYYSRKNNEFIYSSYTIFVAEVASTTNELLLLDYLIKNAKDDDEKFFLIDHYLDMFKSTVFRQTMFAEFEKLTHEACEKGESLTLDKFNEIYYILNQDYFGPSVIIDKDIELEWARIPHFYNNFYVYKYATGFSSAQTLSKRILSGDPEKLKAYLNFLKDGGNNYPLDQLKNAGVDIADRKSLEIALDAFKENVDIFEKMINK